MVSEVQYLVSVGGVVLRDDRVLVERRIKGRDIGHWRIPSGLPVEGESLTDTIVREVEEETGVKAESEGLLAVRNMIFDLENRRIHEVHLVYECTGCDGFRENRSLTGWR